MSKFYGVYKCRLCGGIKRVKAEENRVLAAYLAAYPIQYEQDVRPELLEAEPIALLISHDCSPRVCGIADFVGFEIED